MNKVFKVNFKDRTGFETGYAAGKKIADNKPYINTAASGFTMKHFCRDGERVAFLPFVDTSIIKNFQQCFRDATKITEIALDTAAATSIGSMFYNCTALKTVNINTANATNMDYLFYKCTALETVGELDIAKGTTYANMFRALSKTLVFNSHPCLPLKAQKALYQGWQIITERRMSQFILSHLAPKQPLCLQQKAILHLKATVGWTIQQKKDGLYNGIYL